MKSSFRGIGLDIVSKEVKILMVLFLAFGIVGFAADWCQGKIGEAFQLLVLTLTLDALVVYAYYNYIIARLKYTPAASFEITQDKDDHYRLIAHLKNNGEQIIQAVVDFGTFVYGNRSAIIGYPQPPDGYPNPPGSIDIKPLEESRVDLYIEKILEHISFTIDQMRKNAERHPPEATNQLRFEVKVEYRGLNTGVTGEPIVQKYFFDFNRQKIVRV